MSSPFVSSLDEATLKKAKDELNEIPSDRQAAIDTLKEWIQMQPHFKCKEYGKFYVIYIFKEKKLFIYNKCILLLPVLPQ